MKGSIGESSGADLDMLRPFAGVKEGRPSSELRLPENRPALAGKNSAAHISKSLNIK